MKFRSNLKLIWDDRRTTAPNRISWESDHVARRSIRIDILADPGFYVGSHVSHDWVW